MKFYAVQKKFLKKVCIKTPFQIGNSMQNVWHDPVLTKLNL